MRLRSLVQNSDVAFTIVVNRQADDDDAGEGDEEEDLDNNNNRVEVDFVQEAVQEAIQEAVQDAVQEVCNTINLTKHCPSGCCQLAFDISLYYKSTKYPVHIHPAYHQVLCNPGRNK